MKINSFLIASLCLLSVSACKKEKEPSFPQPYPDYGAMKAGNFWIYQIYEIDPAGNETATNEFDSCFVSADTLINGHTYHKMHRPDVFGTRISYQRDSLSYIVDVYGNILFSSSDFNRTFFEWYHIESNQDTVYHTTRSMVEKDQDFITPAGHFTTSNFQSRHKVWPNYVSHFSEIVENTRYAKNIGIVCETMHGFLSAPVKKERRLVRVHLEL